ncbi:MAG: PsiF family protein [Lysobacter sp.]|nr:PsiF family protein [Lysobacter sp.]
MKTQLRHVLACAVVSALYAFPALAAENAPKAPTPPAKAGIAPADESQQDRMRRCNATAKEKELKGDERRAFMSSCLKR